MKTICAVLLAAWIVFGHEQLEAAFLGGGQFSLASKSAIKLGIKRCEREQK